MRMTSWKWAGCRVAAPVLLTVLALAAAAPAAVGPFKLGSLSAGPGETVSGFLAVPEKDGAGTSIPVTIVHGATEGRVLACVAGVHGYEYPPVLAMARLREEIDPRTLAGTLILVHVANLPSFQRRTIYYNPHDWKNLNRVFPGDPEGTMSQRIAHVLTETVVRSCDALIDMHCGDGNEALIPYTYWMVAKDETVSRAGRDMALAFGIPHIIIDDTRTQDPNDSRYLGNTAVLRGKPAITTESGFMGRSDLEDIERNVRGVHGVLRLLGMRPDGPDPCDTPVWIDKYEVVNSGHDGLFHPLVPMGHYVAAGQKIGRITDYFGRTLDEPRAPFAGILLYIINTPPANKGEPLFEVGRVRGI